MYEALSAEFDLILFAGQSNMAGRGNAPEAPLCPPGVAWEYRAVTDPHNLYPLTEPFGKNENIPGFINDGDKKTGSLASAFAWEYHRLTGRAVVGVSASRGGTSSQEWRDGLVQDAAMRLRQAKAWLNTQGLTPAHTLVLWCQGETDGDHGISAAEYRRNLEAIWHCLQSAGAEKCGLIQIGHFNRRMYPADGRDVRYAVIREEQMRIAEEVPGIFSAGSFEKHESLMKDAFHYYQQVYNEIGTQAARCAASLLGSTDGGKWSDICAGYTIASE